MKFDNEQILKIAELSQLKLSPSEVEQFKTEFNNLIQHLNKINAADTQGISTLPKQQTNWREDEVKPNQDFKVTDFSPNTEDDYFKVPRIIE